MSAMSDDALEKRLREAQGRIAEADAIHAERRAAALACKDAGWTKYRIGAVLGVSASTVTSILKAAGRTDDA